MKSTYYKMQLLPTFLQLLPFYLFIFQILTKRKTCNSRNT